MEDPAGYNVNAGREFDATIDLWRDKAGGLFNDAGERVDHAGRALPTEGNPVMPYYQCHKIVQAVKIGKIETHHDYALIGYHQDGPRWHRVPLEWLQKHKPAVGWFFVRYDSGYESASPANEFEPGYKLLNGADGFDYSMALTLIKAGKRLARVGWNGKDMFIFLVPGSTFKVNRPPLLGIFLEGTEIDYLGHIDMRTADGSIVPWLCSQADQLADDWGIVE